MRDRLLRRIIELLTAQPWLTAAQLAAAIADAAVTRSDVNSILHRHRDDLFERDESRTPPRWALRAGVGSGRASNAEGGGSPSKRPTRPKSSVYCGPELRDWQRVALDDWGSHDHRAVIESVDGSGKTLVGVVAAAEAGGGPRAGGGGRGGARPTKTRGGVVGGGGAVGFVSGF